MKIFRSGRFGFAYGKQKYLLMWSNLAGELNNLGPEKSILQYQAVS